MIIGIAGTIGSGKGTIVEYLHQKKHFGHYSSSGRLKEILEERGESATRLNLSTLADELMKEKEGGILQLSHERAQANGDADYILESIHRESEAVYVRSIGGIILGLDADLETRFERTQKRQEGEKDNVTFEEFKESAAREDEGVTGTGPNICAVLKNADYMITNNGTLEELYVQVDEVLEKISEQ